MPQLIVRQSKEKVVKKLKQRSGARGVSMDEEPRRILRESALGKACKRLSLKAALLSMPNVGKDADFQRGPQFERPIQLSHFTKTRRWAGFGLAGS
jgi:plasmid stability protein